MKQGSCLKILILALIIIFVCACKNKHSNNESVSAQISSTHSNEKISHLNQIIASDTLRVISMYGPLSYFLYKDNDMGFEYELAKRLCLDLGVNIKMIIADSEEQMIEFLQKGKGDLIAYRVPYTSKNKHKLLYTKQEYTSTQVIVQCKSDSAAKDVLDLYGREVWVIPNTIYSDRLQTLNNEIGGGIKIKFAEDSLNTDDLIAMTAIKEIPMTVATNDIAYINSTYFKNLDCSLDITFPQRSAWVVAKNDTSLCNYINKWSADQEEQIYYSAIYRKYFQRSKYFESQGYVSIPGSSQISPYDELFRIYSKIPDWDWRLLAAVAFKESNFNPDAVSWAGACGLMQLMPNTAKSLGLTEADFHEPELSIRAGATYIKNLEKLFPSVGPMEEKAKFVLAAYNSGPGHVFDARALAKKYGKNPDLWEGNVEVYIKLKSEPEYYSDEVCRFGYCRGSETANYVNTIMSKYAEYKLWARP